MGITEIIKSNANIQLVISSSDLREYSLNLIDDVLSKKDVEQNKEQYLTTNEVAKRLNVDISTLWRWEKCNYLVPSRIGGRKRYKESDIKEIEAGKI